MCLRTKGYSLASNPDLEGVEKNSNALVGVIVPISFKDLSID
jgi:hypothetical protein